MLKHDGLSMREGLLKANVNRVRIIFSKYFPWAMVGYYILLFKCLTSVAAKDATISGLFYVFITNKYAIALLAISSIFAVNVRGIIKELGAMYEDSKFMKELLMDKSPVAIIQVDASGKITYINEAVHSVFKSSGIVGKNILDMKSVGKTSIQHGIKKALSGIAYEIKNESYISRLTENKRNLDVYIYPTYGHRDKTKVNGAVAFFYDITEEVSLRNKMESNYLSTIETLASLVDARDRYTGEHSKNVSIFTVMLCNELGIEGEELRKIKLAADFHDIGKIGISDLILNKPDRLTDEEYAKMKKHPSLGADIIRKIDGFEEISEIIRHHHESWCGKGYPDNLAGDDIPYGAQIIAVADTYDAITSDRVYRKGKPMDVALRIIAEEKGRQFNPEIAQKFIDAMQKQSCKAVS